MSERSIAAYFEKNRCEKRAYDKYIRYMEVRGRFMGICEQLRGAKFSKSVAGYNPKEVDGFLTDILNSAEQSEQSLVGAAGKAGRL